MSTIIDSLVVKLGLDPKDLESRVPGVTKSLKEIEKESKKSSASVAGVGKASKDTSKGLGDLTKAAGGFLAVIGGTMAIKAFIADFIEANAQLYRFSQNLNLSVSTVSAWSNAAEEVGGSAAGLQGTFDMLSKAQTELKLTGQSSLIPYFASLGISLADLNGKARPVDDILLSLADRFSHMDRTTANNMGRMMGIDQGTMNLLLQGRHELELTIKRQKESTAVTKAQAEEAVKLQKEIVDTKQKFTALGNSLMLTAAPAIESVLNVLMRLGDWVLANREFVTDFLKVVAVSLGAIALAAAPIELTTLAIVALAAGIALLWQDYQTWKRGGDSLIDWSKWEPGITAAKVGLQALGDVAKETFGWLFKAGEWIDKHRPGNNPAARAAADAEAAGSPVNAASSSTVATAQQIQKYFESQGWTPAQAAGIASNIHSESGGKINATGDNGTAYGLGQWHPDRQANFKKLFNKDIKTSTLAEQLAFMQWELTNTEKGAGDALRNTTTAADAGAVISRKYERPADAVGEASRRGAYAATLAGVPGASSAAASPSSSPGGSPTSITIGKIEVHTQATDAPAIAADIGHSLNYLLTSQANTGL